MAPSSQTTLTCFESIAQIRALDDFRENNPLTQQSYHSLIGHYNFGREKVYCCVEKANGQLCKHEHGKGWLARKIDGTLTIIGGHCANDKFGADSKFLQDISNFRNAERRQARLAKVLMHLEQRDEREQTLKAQRQMLQDLRARNDAFFDDVGPKTKKRLLDMARMRSPDVMVIGVKYREYIEDGHFKKERSTVRHRVGTLKGLDSLANESATPIIAMIADILAAFKNSASLGENPSKGVVNTLAIRLDQYDHVLRQVDTLMHQEAQFNDNSMLLLCFLVDDRTEQSKCARRAMHQVGISGGRDQAKNWLAEQEARLVVQQGWGKMEIGG